MTIQSRIQSKLSEGLTPVHLEVINESHMHSVPPNSETHFKVIIVSGAFDGDRLVQRHRKVNALLTQEIADGVHALSIVAQTPEQWGERGGDVPASPKCHGGSKT